ncbi:MAG: tetratricopeptide repeat protein [Candidatus Atribacteria bacterium]|nr:tetratricopeptide repeat protein [Candidatus Atribacteria bacterium]
MEQKEIGISKNNTSFFTNAIEATLIALIISTPLVFYPYLVRIFNPPKELAFNILVIIGLMFWFLKMTAQEEFKIIRIPLNLPVLAFMAICALSLFWSNSPMVSLLELPLFLAGPILYFIVANNIRDEHQINRLLTVLLIISSLLGIYGIFQYQGIDFAFWKGNVARSQVFGLFGNVNYFAEYLIVPLPLAISLFLATRNRAQKILLLVGILAMGGSLILTFTRGSYLAIGISSLFMFFLYLASRGKNLIKEHKKIFIFVLVVALLVTGLFIFPNPLNKSGTVISKIKGRISISQFTSGSSLKRREAIWGFTTLMIRDHPLLGSGLGTFKYNSLSYQAKFFGQGENRLLYPYGIARESHNEYLQIGAEVGMLGLGIFFWLIITYFNYGIKLLKRIQDRYRQGMIIGLMGGIMAVLIDAIFGFPLHLPATLVLFWLFIGFIISIKYSGQETKIEEKKKLESKARGDGTESNIYKFKPLLYLVIMLLALFLCVIIVRPFVAQIYQYYGVQYAKKADYDTAAKNFQEALKWNPYFGVMYYSLGQIISQKGIYTPAIENFEKAEKYIDHPDLPQKLAYLYLKKGQGDKSITKLKLAISYQKYEKSMVPLYTDLGKLYLQARRYKLAEAAFGNALKIAPDFVNAHYGLAVAYLQQNKQTEALEELQKVIELAPDSREAQYARDTIQKIAQEKLKSQPTETDN